MESKVVFFFVAQICLGPEKKSTPNTTTLFWALQGGRDPTIVISTDLQSL